TIGNGILYAIIGRETCPTTGRQHLQCFLKFNSPVRFSTLQAKIPRGTHIESAKGTDFQNFKYCSKEAIQEEIGTRPLEPKKRISEIHDDCLRKYRRNELTREQFADDHPTFVMRNMARIITYKNRFIEDREEPTELYLIIGDSGIGKSRFARKLSKSTYTKTANMGPWWDGYEQQELVILDDFYGWISPVELFNLADSTQHMVPIKGGFVKFTSKAIVITSNKLPEHWWKPEVIKKYHMTAFNRRVTLTWIWTANEQRSFFNYNFNQDLVAEADEPTQR
ncbi:unnamed protein product, partial [Onchocerca ochengi]|uniref:ATP-dependent helicase Rep n=1 Tax=Onchocerca ochengi TaxID=42157 RepID=A0A182EY76_ONCOC